MFARSKRLPALAALTLIAAAACGGDLSRAPMPANVGSAESKVAASPPAMDMAARQDAIAGSLNAPAPQPNGPALPPGSDTQTGAVNPSMIIRTGNASVEVDSLELAIAAVQRIATSLGGWVGNTSLASGDYEVRRATIELKIPSARYDEALAGLKPIGKVESVTSNAEDVGEEFVDLTARTANARRLEERLITLLATRTGKLEDVLSVERELARVREEIERYDGRIRYLRTRIATSTLSVTVHERAPLVSPSPGENVIAEAFRDAWRNFVHFLAAFIASLGVLVPLLALLALAVYAWRKLVSPRSGKRSPTAPSRPDGA